MHMYIYIYRYIICICMSNCRGAQDIIRFVINGSRIFHRSLSRLPPEDHHNTIDVMSAPEIKKLKLQCREIAVPGYSINFPPLLSLYFPAVIRVKYLSRENITVHLFTFVIQNTTCKNSNVEFSLYVPRRIQLPELNESLKSKLRRNTVIKIFYIHTYNLAAFFIYQTVLKCVFF